MTISLSLIFHRGLLGIYTMTTSHTFVTQREFLQGRVVGSVERGRKSFEKFPFLKKNIIKTLDNVNKVCYPPPHLPL